MGHRHSISYKPLKNTEDLVELEEYPPSSPQILSSSDLHLHTQKLIILGYPLEAYKLLLSHNPNISSLFLPFHMQEFLELIKKRKTIEALSLAQKAFPPYKSSKISVTISKKNIEITINDLMGLLCYEDPDHSPLGYLLDTTMRNSLCVSLDLFLNPRKSKKNTLKKLCCCRRKKITD